VTRKRDVWFVLPDGIDDPDRVSGGNIYDRQLRQGLAARGWTLRMAPVADRAAAAEALDRVASGGIVLLDGLVAGWAPDAVEAAAARIPVVIIAHMISSSFSGARDDLVTSETRALRSASRVIATSEWTAGELVRMGLVDGERIAVALPGSREATRHTEADHRSLLCVGAIAAHKGQDVLLAALRLLADRPWACTLVGSRTVDPDFAARIAAAASEFGDRIRMPGVLHGAALDRAYDRAGLLVAPSRVESFGMAAADARSRGLPVLASAVGGIPEAIAGGGALLVPPDEPRALADALDRWFTEPALRSRLRQQAELGSLTVPRWADTVDRVDRVLEAI
jgi:glycosyltransferase involved in cell wall biosynthesis